MLEMASLGAKVLQSRSVEFAAKFNVPLEVASSFREGKGTLVTREDEDMEAVAVSGVTGDRNQAKVTVVGVPDKPGIAAALLGPVAKANIVVDMIIQNVSHAMLTDFSFTIPRVDVKKAVPIIQDAAKEIGAKSVSVTDSIAKVSLVGVGMRSHSGVASKMFEVLAREGVNIMMISTSEIKISCVIDEKYLELALRALHAAFGLDQSPVRNQAGV
jgi:aspartate kinase